MCLQGSGNSARNLRRSQFATAQRGVQTSRYEVEKNPQIQTITKSKTTAVDPRTAKGATTPSMFNREPATMAKADVAPTVGSSRKTTNEPLKTKAPRIVQKAVSGIVNSSTNGIPTTTYTQVGDQFFKTVETVTKKMIPGGTTLKQVANAQQRVAIDDGSMARKKSRAARMGVANANQLSVVKGKKPKIGALKIDISGAQVPGA